MPRPPDNPPLRDRGSPITKFHASENERRTLLPNDPTKELELLALTEAFESSPDSVFIKTPRGKLIYANNAFRRTFAVNHQGEGQLDYHSLPADLKPISRFTDEHLVRQRRTLTFSYVIAFPNREPQRFFTTKTPLLGPDGEVSAILEVSSERSSNEVVDPWDARDLLTMKQAQDSFASIAEKERKAILLACAGYPNKKIARELDISIRSVERYRGQCLDSFRVGSFAKLVRAIHQLEEFGLIPSSD